MNRCQSTLALWPFFLSARRRLLPAIFTSLPGLQRICYHSTFCTEVKAWKTGNGWKSQLWFVPICSQVSLSKFWLQGDTVLVTLRMLTVSWWSSKRMLIVDRWPHRFQRLTKKALLVSSLASRFSKPSTPAPSKFAEASVAHGFMKMSEDVKTCLNSKSGFYCFRLAFVPFDLSSSIFVFLWTAYVFFD